MTDILIYLIGCVIILIGSYELLLWALRQKPTVQARRAEFDALYRDGIRAERRAHLATLQGRASKGFNAHQPDRVAGVIDPKQRLRDQIGKP